MSGSGALVGQVILGEHEVLAVARESEALVVLSCRSTLDQRSYTVAVAPKVTVATSSSALSSAVERASRHAIGERNLLPLLAARVLTIDEQPRIALIRRGEPLPTVEAWLGTPRSAAEVARLLGPVGQALTALHDQGMVHGAVSKDTLVIRDGALVLDFFGIAQVAEAADGARGAEGVFAASSCPPELVAGSLPGPWTDVYGLASIAIAMLGGAAPPPARSEPIEGISHLGTRLEDALRLAVARSPSPRPTVDVFLRGLLAGDPPAARTSSAQREPDVRPVQKAGDKPPLAAQLAGPRAAEEPAAPPNDGARLAWVVAGVLGLFAASLGGVLGWVLWTNQTGTKAAAASASTTAPPPLPAPVTASAAPTSPDPPAGGLSATLHVGKAAYPADQDALVPVESDGVVRGDRDALVTLVVFGDLTCPFTARLLQQLPSLEARFAADLRVVWKSHPSPSSPDATNAIESAMLVRDKKGDVAFWRFVETVAGTTPDAGRLEEIGIKAGLDAGAITRAIAARPARAKIDRDVELARRLGVRGTPVLFVNGRRMDGTWGHDVLRPVIEAEMARMRPLLSTVAREKLYATRVIANVTTAEGER